MLTMKNFLTIAASTLLTLFAVSVSAQSADNGRFLSLTPPDGLPIIPVLEGWIDNQDGPPVSLSASSTVMKKVDIPLGEANRIEPAKWDGVQPTYFPPGRSTGAFTVTVPNSERETDVWWHLKTGDSEELKVPGRYGASAYELDFIRPRPQGALQPRVGLGDDGDQLPGLYAQIGDYQGGAVSVGQRVELVVNASDPAERDPLIPVSEALPMGVAFMKYQGPGDVEFTPHESTPAAENPYNENDRRYSFWRAPAANGGNHRPCRHGTRLCDVLSSGRLHYQHQSGYP